MPSKSPKEITTAKGEKMAKEKEMENSLQKVLALGALSLGVVAITNAADPATIIKQRCQSCHGPKMEKQALGKSKITNTLTPEQIKTSLLGYKAKTLNTFGLGATMWGQAASLSAEDIDALSKYIPTLKGK